MNETLKQAIEVYGGKSQILIAVEEMSELTKELMKYINRGHNNKDKIAEEIADVEIMMEQLKYYFKVDTEVGQQRQYKIDRLKTRLENSD